MVREHLPEVQEERGEEKACSHAVPRCIVRVATTPVALALQPTMDILVQQEQLSSPRLK